ncbi:CopD family protein [Rhizobium sp. S153]|uniref:Protoporphyrinogen IX oxidase n=1 Tax=Ciceribacter sichuanensis TaxID=2949647 RepID=A0ABT0VDI4_9HYPH|nr:CopD family protein [Ciceribacter sp. S153]MCM2403949.1 CopD family protein [Ciceribacter sp. S153]
MYIYAKAIHVFAVGTLIGGMLFVAILLRLTSGKEQSSDMQCLVRRAIWWDSRISTPALFVAWAAGFSMAADAGWFYTGWMLLKLIPVALLTGLQLFSGTMLEKLALGGRDYRSIRSYMPAAVLLAFAPIVFLAVVKPF